MRCIRFALAAALCAGALGSRVAAQGQNTHTQQASGQDNVTIRVPLDLSNMDASVSQAEIYCQATFEGDQNRVQARNQTAVNLANGAFKGDVNVPLALSVAQHGEKWDYTCKLSLYNGVTKQWSFVGMYPWSQPQAGTTPNGANSGTITVQ